MKAVRIMLDAPNPSDYVVATGVAHSVEHFVNLAFSMVNLDVSSHLEIDQSLFRPNEVKDLLGNPAKIMKTLGWKPETNFEALVREMLDYDLENS